MILKRVMAKLRFWDDFQSFLQCKITHFKKLMATRHFWSENSEIFFGASLGMSTALGNSRDHNSKKCKIPDTLIFIHHIFAINVMHCNCKHVSFITKSTQFLFLLFKQFFVCEITHVILMLRPCKFRFYLALLHCHTSNMVGTIR